MRDGRSRLMSTKLAEQHKIEQQEKDREKAELSRQIAEEEKKLKDLEIWVSNWAQAQPMRDFIAVLEKFWTEEGHDLSPVTQKGRRITWMKQQADRIDPMPPS